MIKTGKHSEYPLNNVLIAGRAGELTQYANPLTFDLLEKIFGQKGPYREILKLYCIYSADTDQSFLSNINGKVYSNLDLENNIIWKNYPYVYRYSNGTITNAFIFKKLTPASVRYYFKKLFRETALIVNLKNTENTIDNIYKSFCGKVDKIYGYTNISSQNFLNYYKDVVFVTYLYELFYEYNRHTSRAEQTRADQNKYSQYITANDYLLNSSDNLLENKLKLPNGFYLDDYENISEYMNFRLSDYSTVPDQIPSPEGKLTTHSLEIKLGCIKNNMRLKTNVLLYFLNKTLIDISYKRGLDNIGFLLLDEIENQNNNNVYYEPTVTERMKEFNLEKARLLPNVLTINETSQN